MPLGLSGEEKKMVEEVFSNAIDCLSDDDKKLPQVCAGERRRRPWRESTCSLTVFLGFVPVLHHLPLQ